MHSMHKLFIVLTLVASILLTSMANAHAAEEVPTFTAKVGELKKITFKLTNNVGKQQPFVNLIQVKNEEGVTVQLSWVLGELQADQEIRPQQSWIPEKPGEYTVEIFVWESVDTAMALSPVLMMKVNVEP